MEIITAIVIPGVYALGMFACLGFVADYLRTADLRSPFTRQMLALNGALMGVLFLVLLTNLEIISPGLTLYLVYVGLFLAVDAALIYQWVLLRKARHREE